MNKLLKILLCVFCVIATILSFAFIFIEGRLLFSGDWLVYHSPVNGFIRYALRLLIALTCAFVCIFELININKEKNKLGFFVTFIQAGLVVFSAVACALTTNFVGVICLVLSVVIFDLKLLLRVKL